VFSTECNPYFDWQSLGLLYSFRKVKQKGEFTRLMACNRTPAPGRHVVPDTHVHPNYAIHPRTKDSYSPYNKPFSIMHWLQHAKPTADYIIVLDADMVFRKAITVAMLGVEKGRPISAHYGYLVGIFKENYMKIKERVPNVEKAQQVGGFTVMHREDLEKVAPRWLYWTEEVRQDPQSWGNTGDIFNANGKAGPPWISEMYGYVFACAEVGVNFKVSNNVMLYPGYQPPPEPWPAVMHYGITYNVDEYAFDKHWYMGSDFTACPGRIFNKPMLPEELHNKPGSMEHRRKTVALTVASSLYEATKWWSGYHCNHTLPDPPKQSYSCSTMSNGVVNCREIKDEKSQSELLERLRGAGLEEDQREECKEQNDNCCNWAANGECEKNPSFMLGSCQRSCNLCGGGCREGCCPPKVVSEEKENNVEEDEEEDENNVFSPPSQMPPPPPPLVHDAGKTWKREDRRTDETREGASMVNAAEVVQDEDTEEEDYDDQIDVASSLGFFGAVFRWNTLLAFGSGAIFTLLFWPSGDSTRRMWKKRRGNKTEKGSQ
jgi:hypothetical protein